MQFVSLFLLQPLRLSFSLSEPRWHVSNCPREATRNDSTILRGHNCQMSSCHSILWKLHWKNAACTWVPVGASVQRKLCSHGQHSQVNLWQSARQQTYAAIINHKHVHLYGLWWGSAWVSSTSWGKSVYSILECQQISRNLRIQEFMSLTSIIISHEILCDV